MQKYIVLEKAIGETPLQCMEAWRTNTLNANNLSTRQGLVLSPDTPLTYAGRLDPMASGKLLVLIGEECKQKEAYNALDKQYRFSVLFDISSDSGDVLGIPTLVPHRHNNKSAASSPHPEPTLSKLQQVCRELIGDIELPYPHYSSKTVNGKPLHTWTLEGRLDEITIPTKQSTIYSLKPTELTAFSSDIVLEYVLDKISTIPPVTEARKALGNDFRRSEIIPAWEALLQPYLNIQFYWAEFVCVASSGTYMRTVASEIAKAVGTTGLAWHIHRETIGRYQPLSLPLIKGFWKQKFN